jgi:hypothetical protein
LDRLKIPLIRVNPRFLDPKSNKGGDPLLAVLFKRIGSGGTPLSNEDYVYSVIKHLRPETFDLVEMLHQKPTVANLLTATDLVMSAVRLAAVTWKPEDDKPVQDMESPNKRDFNRLLERGDFINEFLQLIQADRGAAIATYFDQVQDMLHYRGDSDIGLPKQVFPLLGRPLVQVLLRLAQVGYLNKVEDMARRKDVLRLVLFWLIAVSNESKASRLAYDVIKEQCGSNIELGRAIYDQLVSEGAAVRLPPPNEIKDGPGLAFSADETNQLRGASRFISNKHGGDTSTYDFYRQRWWRSWTHRHPILLWVQREMVANKLDAKTDPMAGKDEDTPYDYDHILPSAHWANWTGKTPGDRLLDFAEEKQIWVVGNAIGNIRVWDSVLNRVLGEESPAEKLKLDVDDEERWALLKDSAVHIDELEHWKLASGVRDQYRSWSRERALAFQTAVEKRTFNLYQRFFDELEFAEWVGMPSSTELISQAA